MQPNSAVCTAAATVQLRHCVEEAEPSAAGLDCQLNEPAAAAARLALRALVYTAPQPPGRVRCDARFYLPCGRRAGGETILYPVYPP